MVPKFRAYFFWYTTLGFGCQKGQIPRKMGKYRHFLPQNIKIWGTNTLYFGHISPKKESKCIENTIYGNDAR